MILWSQHIYIYTHIPAGCGILVYPFLPLALDTGTEHKEYNTPEKKKHER